MTDAPNHGSVPPRGPDGALLAAALGALSGSAKVDALIERQIHLADLQIADSHRDERLHRSSLRYAHASTVMKVVFELAVALFVAAVSIAVLSAVWSAHKANGLVIESFQVPSSFAERGLTGQVVASHLLDKLAGLQDRTDSFRAPDSYANNWGDDIKVQIPDTGVSIGEFNRYLRQWLGHETHITGEVWRDGDDVSVVARAGAEEGTVFTGKERDLDALLEQAAEAVYEKTQPYRYAAYIANKGEVAKAGVVLAKVVASSPPSEQAWAYALWSNADFDAGDWRAVIDKTGRAIALDPDNALAWENRGELERERGEDETALRDFRKTLEISESGRADINPEKLPVAIRFARVNIGQKTGAFSDDLMLLGEIEHLPSYALSSGTGPIIKIIEYGGLHDSAGLNRQIAVAGTIAANKPQLTYYLLTMSLQGAAAAGDWRRAISAHDALAAYANKSALVRDIYMPTRGAAWYALALAGEGDFAAAWRVIAATPRDCDVCLRARGRIAAMQKDWARADYWFAAATKQAPSIPYGYTDWARMLLDRGDVAGAIAKARTAHDLGPRFADPLEIWGEALMAQNRSDLALSQFAEAARYAPNWALLHRKWSDALRYAGKPEDAKAQAAIAARLSGG
jgi:tetratricopeptide (TPR) repeat protein